jgi:hypothetical protein
MALSPPNVSVRNTKEACAESFWHLLAVNQETTIFKGTYYYGIFSMYQELCWELDIDSYCEEGIFIFT